MSTFTINAPEENGYEVTAFEFKNIGDTILTRYFEKHHLFLTTKMTATADVMRY